MTSKQKDSDVCENAKDNGSSPPGMVLIPAGEFEMGDHFCEGHDDRRPVHTVYVDAFYMDTYEVTIGQYKEFINATGYKAPNWSKVAGFSPPDDQGPIICVSWYDAMAYAQWVGKRLPTESEWEKAARGGLRKKKYPWSDSTDNTKANYNSNSGPYVGRTTPVGSYAPNGYGLYDMAGNVWEWCLDEYDERFYVNSPPSNPIAGDASISDIMKSYERVNSMRVLRGGSWSQTFFNNFLQVANRLYYYPAYSLQHIGFRCAVRSSELSNNEN